MSLLLPTTNKNFQAMAERAADKLFSDGTPLNTSVADIAKELQLNPEELRRLVEKTNLVATVKLLTVSTDKKATLDLAEYEEVLNNTHPVVSDQKPVEEEPAVEEAPVTEKTAGRGRRRVNAYDDFVTIFGLTGHEKTASALEKNKSHVSIFHKKRELEESKLAKAASEILAKDSLDWLASEFSRYNGPSFSKFAEEALALHGVKCTPIIKGLSGYLKCQVDMEKVASHIIDDTTAPHKKLAELCGHLEDLVAHDLKIISLKADLDSEWASALGK